MTTITTPSSLALVPSLETAWQDVDSSFERFCLTAGIGAIEQMLCEDAQQLAGTPHNRGGGRVGHRWGRTKGKIGFHGGKVAVVQAGTRRHCVKAQGLDVSLRPLAGLAQNEEFRCAGCEARSGRRLGETRPCKRSPATKASAGWRP